MEIDKKRKKGNYSNKRRDFDSFCKMAKLKAYNERKILFQEEEKMNYKKLTAVFMALGIAATCFSGCGLTEGNGGTSASEPTKAAATAAPKDTATPTPKATAAPKLPA